MKTPTHFTVSVISLLVAFSLPPYAQSKPAAGNVAHPANISREPQAFRPEEFKSEASNKRFFEEGKRFPERSESRDDMKNPVFQNEQLSEKKVIDTTPAVTEQQERANYIHDFAWKTAPQSNHELGKDPARDKRIALNKENLSIDHLKRRTRPEDINMMMGELRRHLDDKYYRDRFDLSHIRRDLEKAWHDVREAQRYGGNPALQARIERALEEDLVALRRDMLELDQHHNDVVARSSTTHGTKRSSKV